MELSETTSVILLVDIDAFFAQVEQILRPELAGRPVVVGGLVTDRSVVASASYEARARGVKTAMPVAQAHRLCPDAVFLRGDFHAYTRFSKALMDLCRHYTPLVEPMSLDEAYLDVSGCRRLFETQGIVRPRTEIPRGGSPDEIVRGGSPDPPRKDRLPRSCAVGQETHRAKHRDETGPANGALGVPPADPWPLEAADHLKRSIKRELQLNVSIGAGTNRVVAKIACDYAKPNGVAWVRPGYEAEFLAPLPLKELPGIGPKTAERLAQYNLQQIGDLVKIPEKMLVEHFGPGGEVLAARARGIDSTPVSAEPGNPKSISRETTFESNLIDRGAMQAMLYYLLERACRQLRDVDLLARTLTVKVRYADFKTESRSRRLPTFSDHDDDFWPVAVGLFNKAYTRRVGVRLVGVALSHFAPSGRQMDLFAEGAYGRRTRYYRSIDRIRERFGFSALATGRAIELLETHARDAHGFKLRTACLSR
jgi:DNA polymerase-4